MNLIALTLRTLLPALLLALTLVRPAVAAPWLDETPRVAVISAFEPELSLLLDQTKQARHFSVNGTRFTTGVLRNKPVVLFLSGISMTNAAMTTQLALDHFKITHIVFSGIAGGVNPDLHIGDVVVAQKWGQYLELLMAREDSPGVFGSGSPNDLGLPGYGMMRTRPVKVITADQPKVHKKFWFDVDPEMLAVAQNLKDIALQSCDTGSQCLRRQPRLVVGGNGVSGAAFVDNAEYRKYVFNTFQANVLDMESAACAMVAYVNAVPFIAFRSLSDLAGGGEGANEMHTFMGIAADNSAKVLLAFLDAWTPDP
ncbi:5'-methylthioadenosine/S-adenosylhomocysteine nucleosidase [Pusillimonas sp. MFBS29]|uniref:5'-methylthioadenosine/S-adenosylhomocysteine nucleosidase n=1 Tax=Pusillimonas sp. MFBS29 TaxID=2886690 RepID=UPI001D1285EB|nr:5'-methylthioadenosine/S-adenosylhomocysteine nucleosidase [Pusillimonas sp. MFBS29]MCC2595645.1 5'-methylthioadenosine/S-adenosylhomocysteine nucleosidase [Pusillimonas sp. MFBS29]